MGTALKRTTIFLTEEQHEGLRRLAFEQRTSMAKLLRDAALENVVFEQGCEIVQWLIDAQAIFPGHGVTGLALVFTLHHKGRPHKFFRARQRRIEHVADAGCPAQASESYFEEHIYLQVI